MQNPRLAERYAKSLMDLAKEQGNLDAIYADMLGIHQICQDSRDFLLLMKSPVVKADTKHAVIKSLVGGKINKLSEAFIALIVNKGREFFIPEICSSFITQYKSANNISDVLLTTSEPLGDEILGVLKEKIQEQLNGQKIELTSQVDPSIIGGFILEANNNLFDASILRDLKDIKKQFMKNEFVPELR